MGTAMETVEKIYLNTAQLVVAETPASVTTVLGSCVSVTFFHPRTAIGAICHAVLPKGPGHAPGKYADQSVRYMMAWFDERGIARREIVVKLFGGSDMFEQAASAGNILTIGAQNVNAALKSLRAGGLEPVVSDTGGSCARKLIFFTHTGEVYLKWLNKSRERRQESSASPRPDRIHPDPTWWRSK